MPQLPLASLAAPLLGLGLLLASSAAQAGGGADVLSEGGDACLDLCDKRFERCEKRAKDHREAGECAFERQECRASCGTKD